MDIKFSNSSAVSLVANPVSRGREVDSAAPEQRVQGAVPVNDPGVVFRVTGSTEATPVYSKPKDVKSSGVERRSGDVSSASTDPSEDHESDLALQRAVNAFKDASNDASKKSFDAQRADQQAAQVAPEDKIAETTASNKSTDKGSTTAEDPKVLLDQADQIIAQVAAQGDLTEADRVLAAKAAALRAQASESARKEMVQELAEHQAEVVQKRADFAAELQRDEQAMKAALREAQNNDQVRDQTDLLRKDALADQAANTEISSEPATETDANAKEDASTVSLAKNATVSIDRTGVPSVKLSAARSGSLLTAIDRITGTAQDTSTTSLYAVT